MLSAAKLATLVIDLKDCADIIERGDEPDEAYASDLRKAAVELALLRQEVDDRDESIANLWKKPAVAAAIEASLGDGPATEVAAGSDGPAK